jgi:predicted phage terminase large subunit-like protein
LSGRGADVLIIDDAHSEGQGAMSMTNPEVLEPTFDWFSSGPRQRLQPGGAMIIVGTRWHSSDLIGRVIEQAEKNPKGQQWEVIEFPAILPSGRALWPQFWPLAELEAIKADIPAYKWNAQYLQRPGGSEVAIIKREYWKQWTKPDPPEIEIVMSAFDTAFTKEKRSNYSACVVMGVFYRTVIKSNGDEDHIPNVILLDAWKERLDFPDLKRKMLEHYKERRPDIFLIENRATGSPLIQEFREMGLVVSEFTPARGMGKASRVNAVVDIFASGRVWAPDTSWAEDVITQCELFPFGAEDDYVDCVSMSLLRLREGGMVSTNRDNAALSDEDMEFRPRRRQYY